MVLIKIVNIFLIFFISISLSQVGVVKSQESNIIYVGGNSDNYSSIQLAIDNANQGDTIYINSGIYHENIVINKELLLIGENSFNTIVDGLENDAVLTILSDNVEIINLTIRNSKINLTNTSFFYSGVLIDSNFNTIKGCQITDNQYAVVMFNSSGNQIIDCDIYENAGGLYLYNSLNNEIFNNRLNHNYLMPSIIIDKNGGNHISKCNISYNDDIGLIIRESNDNVINENIFLNNPIGIRIFETLNFSSKNNYIYMNNFHNNINAFDDGRNNWDNGIVGNYWNDYENVDENGDGKGEVPYLIPLINYDNYPSIIPIEIDFSYEIKNDIEINVVYPSNNSEVNKIIILKVEASSNIFNITLIKIKIDDGEYIFANGTNYWEFEINTTLHEDGLHQIFIFALDEAGNFIEKSISVNILNANDSLDDSNNDNNVPGFGAIFFIISILIIIYIFYNNKIIK